jgi:hypothetical protein
MGACGYRLLSGHFHQLACHSVSRPVDESDTGQPHGVGPYRSQTGRENAVDPASLALHHLDGGPLNPATYCVHDGCVAAERVRWNVGWGLRAFMWACFGVVLVIAGLLATHGARPSDRIGGWILLSATPVVAWLFTIRPYIEKVGDDLIVQNPVRRHRVRLAEVEDLSLLNTGLALRLTDGSQVVAWAVQQGLLLTVLGSETRALRAEQLIRRAAKQARRAPDV